MQRCWLQESPNLLNLLASWGSSSKQVSLGAFTFSWKLLCVLSGDASSRLETDWQLLCGSSDAAGDLMNERKSWRDLCLTPQRYLLYPFCTSGQNARPFTLKYKASYFPVYSNDMWCLKSVLRSNLIMWYINQYENDVLGAFEVGCKMANFFCLFVSGFSIYSYLILCLLPFVLSLKIWHKRHQ